MSIGESQTYIGLYENKRSLTLVISKTSMKIDIK